MPEEIIITTPVHAWPIASNAIALRASPGWSGDALRAWEWRILRLPDEPDNEFVPRPSRIVSTPEGAELLLDGDMRPGVSYRVIPPRLSDDNLPEEPEIIGPQRTTAQVIDPSDRPLSDWSMPGTADRLTGDIAVAANDYATVNGLEAIRTAIWSAILTPRGRIDWDPTFGTDLALKRARAVDLVAEQRRLASRIREIPGVRAASVQVAFTNDHARIHIDLQLSDRTMVLQREVGHGAQ